MSESTDFQTIEQRLDRIDRMISGLAHQVMLIYNAHGDPGIKIRPPYKETFNSSQEPDATCLCYILENEADQEAWKTVAGTPQVVAEWS